MAKIDLNSLCAVAAELDATLHIEPHENKPVVVLRVRKGRMEAKAEIENSLLDWLKQRADSWLKSLVLDMIKRLEEYQK